MTTKNSRQMTYNSASLLRHSQAGNLNIRPPTLNTGLSLTILFEAEDQKYGGPYGYHMVEDFWASSHSTSLQLHLSIMQHGCINYTPRMGIPVYPANLEPSNRQSDNLQTKQLTEYIISANEDEEKNTVRYKTLKSNQKPAMQFWLTEAKTWPSFQKITLRVRFSTNNGKHAKLTLSCYNQGFFWSCLLRHQSVIFRHLALFTPSCVIGRKVVFIKFNANNFTDAAEVDDFICYDE
uniref:Uncharacterized protein n=1 Tax=Romanomermis culicivorax TaxID=13658 RepID=A0A915HM10_ROMCU